jgi:hypothetical protein
MRNILYWLLVLGAPVVVDLVGLGAIEVHAGEFNEQYISPVTTTDVSPDALPGEVDSGNVDPGGRIVSVVMNPKNQLILYAASEMAGVWKSVNGGGRWQQASNGLRSGISLQHRQALAIDDQNPDRLLYLTQDDDGRVGQPFGGLWVTTDSAATWTHVDMPSCAPASLLGAVFAMGQPFVATRCGVATSTDASLGSGTWSYLGQLPFPPDRYALATLPNSRSLFACRGAQVFRSLSLGAPGSWSSAAIPGGCLALAVTPDDARKVIVIHFVQVSGRMVVSLLDMDSSGQQFQSVGPPILPDGCQGSFGSGAAGVFLARRFDIPENFGPGRSYEVFAGTGCLFHEYQLVGDTIGQWTVIPNTHVDTWAMTITPDYSPEQNKCNAYLTTDGGVFAHFSGCDLTQGWLRAMSGLHVMYSDTMAGVSRPHSKCAGAGAPCPTLYLPTGDNDVWVTDSGGVPNNSWKYLGSGLGDAATALNDPALPNTLLVARNQTYKIAVSANGEPPGPGVSFQDITPPSPSDGGSPPALANLAQVLTMPDEAPIGSGDYVAVESPGNSKRDVIVRNISGLVGAWVDVSSDDRFSFGPGQVGAIAISNGHQHPVIYVLTSPNADYSIPPVFYGPGQIWKGVAGDPILRWVNASRGILKAYNLYADPYDPSYAYVTDLGDRTIKYTNDGGVNWYVDKDLTDLATNYGEFVFDCGSPGRSDGEQRTSALAWSCPLQAVAFDRNHPNIRAVALWFGGVVFSRDAGRHWIPLLVTNNGPFDTGPPEFPFSLFYDSEPNPTTGHPSLFMGVLGRSVMRVDGPLLDVVAGRIAICPICAGDLFGDRSKQIVLVLDSLKGGVPLKPDVRGYYRGSFLFDASKFQSITYHFDINGKESTPVTHTLSAAELSSGVVLIGGNVTSVLNKAVEPGGANRSGRRQSSD